MLFFSEGFGGNDIAASGQDLAFEGVIDASDIGVATDDQSLCPDFAAGGFYHAALTLCNGSNRGLFENLNTQFASGAGLATDQVKWVQVTTAHIDQSANIAIRAHHFVHLVLAQQAGFIRVVDAVEPLLVLPEALQMARFVGEVAIAHLEVAVN